MLNKCLTDRSMTPGRIFPFNLNVTEAGCLQRYGLNIFLSLLLVCFRIPLNQWG